MSTEIPVDDETRAALLLFNERVEASASKERAAKRLAKAERAKDEAAARVRSLENDSSATAEAKAEAQELYKAALDNLQTVTENPDAAPAKPAKSEDAPADEPSTGDAAPIEVSADEEPPGEAGADASAAADAETPTPDEGSESE
ncbi:MAG: hypothetical protein ACR2P0_13425 [Acidimicrobiales bacterium]